jgi:ribose transport system permease protein
MQRVRTSKFYRFIGKNLIISLLVLMIVGFSFLTTGFATSNNFFNLLRQCSIMGIVAAGVSIVIIAGGIDLSVGSSISLFTVVTASLITSGVNVLLSCVAGIILCIFIGFVNGLIITKTKMTPFIATLAMMQVLRGIAFTITGGMPIYGLPDEVKTLGQGYIGVIPVPVIVLVLVFAVATFLMSKTYLGRYLYAVGSNVEATRLSGINTDQIKILSYVISGFFVGIAGLITMARIGAGQANAADGMEMDVITACVVGGISMAGGIGKMPMVIVGTIVIGVISNGLGIMGVSTYGQLIFKGIILILVVGVDSLRASYIKGSE